MIVVTGATGQYGPLVIEGLLQRGAASDELAAIVRDPQKATGLAARGVQVRRADYNDPELLAEAFAGADKVLLVSSDGPTDVRVGHHRNAVTAAKQAGVGLLVYTSLVNAADSPLSMAAAHRETERVITASGIPAVVLRNSWYTENYTAQLPGAVERGVIVGTAGNGRIASAARADLAEAAAVVLLGDGHTGKVYELTGEEAWSLPELAAETTKQSGKEVVYNDLAPEQYGAILTGVGFPDYMVDLLVDAEVQISKGALATTTGDLAALLGRSPTRLAERVATALK
jgi:NAD(P)H dehydrogenase (quinone)